MNEGFTKGLKKFKTEGDEVVPLVELENEIPKYMGDLIEEEKVVEEIPKPINQKKFPSIRDRKKFEKKQAVLKKSEVNLLSEPEQSQENKEGTPKENREELKKVIELLDGTFQDEGDEGSEWEKIKEAYLSGRLEELDAEVEELGVVEKYFRSLGEKYNKLGWKSKLGVGVALGLGTAAFSTVSVPAAFACISGLVAQRVAGMASMFLKFEKNKKIADQPEQRKKELAMLMAAGYTVAMGAAIYEGVHLAGESAWGEATHEWLKQHWPFSHTETAAAQTPDATISQEHIVQHIHTPELEMPRISVDASAGHGYEYMTKQIWEQLHDPEKHFTLPPNTDPNSDIAKLFAADESSVDAVVHQIAADPQHGFFNADGTSVQINPTDRLFIAADGQVRIVTPDYSNVSALENAPMTSQYPSEALAVHSVPVVPETPIAPIPATETIPVVETPVAPAQNAEMPVDSTEAAVQAESSVSPVVGPAEAPDTVAVETPAMHENIVVNSSGFEIPTDEPHFYTDADNKHILVYGGSPSEKMKAIGEYIANNQDKIVYSADANGEHRIPWYVSDGKLVAGAPVHTKGLFGFFKSFMGAPEPDELKSLIK